MRPAIGAREIAAVARVDLWYGTVAAAIPVLGFTRAIFAAKGYYAGNIFFWAKIVTFLVIGLLSVRPTVLFIRWRRASVGNAAFVPLAVEIEKARRFLWAEALLFALLPIFAAAMARGYGS